jgi:hypothetical protein
MLTDVILDELDEYDRHVETLSCSCGLKCIVKINFNIDIRSFYPSSFLLLDWSHPLPLEMSLYGFEYPPPVPRKLRDGGRVRLALPGAAAEKNDHPKPRVREAKGDTELEIEYEKIMNRVKQTRESIIRMNDRHFTAPVDKISGTVKSVSDKGIELKEYPGRRFQFSSVGMSAADMSARILGEHNDMCESGLNREHSVHKIAAIQDYPQ